MSVGNDTHCCNSSQSALGLCSMCRLFEINVKIEEPYCPATAWRCAVTPRWRRPRRAPTSWWTARPAPRPAAPAAGASAPPSDTPLTRSPPWSAPASPTTPAQKLGYFRWPSLTSTSSLTAELCGSSSSVAFQNYKFNFGTENSEQLLSVFVSGSVVMTVILNTTFVL